MENVSWLAPVTAKVFATTRWTVITACTQTDEAKARAALEELCQSYWQPVYVCIRRRGYTSQDAQDLTQDFFLRVLNGAWLKHLDEAKGRFRAYLAVALRNFLHDRWRGRWTLWLGRGSTVVPIEVQEAENSYASALATQTTPETLYERQWARTVIGCVFDGLRIELRADGKEALMEHFEAILAAKTHDFPYADLARTLGTSVGNLHGTLHRWRKRFHTLMREEIARTVLTRAEIDDELRHLQRIFAQAE